MENQQLIKQIEIKIQEIKTMLTNYQQEITKYENILVNLIQQASELKIQENKNNNK